MSWRNLPQVVFAVTMLIGCANDRGRPASASAPEMARQPKSIAAAEHGNRGVDLFEKAKFDAAIKEFSEAIILNPDNPLGYYYRGVSLVLTGQNEQAITDFNEAIRLNPKYWEAWQYRGIARGRSKQFQGSVGDFKRAIELNPKLASAYSCLAALYATCYDDNIRNAAEAVQAATKACDLTDWKVAQHIDRLAAAHAESGDWDKAMKYENQAIRMGAATQEDHNRMIIRLSLYKFHHPFRDPTIFE